MFCSNCGAQLPDGSKFCGSCGAQQGGAPTPQQPVYQQPQYQQQPQMAQQQWQQAQPKKKSKLVPIAIVAAVIVVIAIVVPKLVDSRTNTPPMDPPSITSVTPTTPSSNQGNSSTGGGGGSPWDVPAQTGGSQSSGGSSQSGGSLLDLNNTGGSSGGGSASSLTAADFSTGKLPHEEDFDWCFDRDLGVFMSKGVIPAGAEPITDPALLGGGWMCLVVRRPSTDPYREFWNMELTINGSDVDCLQHWSGTVQNGGTFVDESDANDNPLFGTIDQNCVLDLNDYYGSKLIIDAWYGYGAKQFGLGTYDCGWADEEQGYIAVCR